MGRHDLAHAERKGKRDFQHAFAVFQHNAFAESGMADVIALLPLRPRLGGESFLKRCFVLKQRGVQLDFLRFAGIEGRTDVFDVLRIDFLDKPRRHFDPA